MSQQADDAADQPDQQCGNCGANVPADAVTCPACAALLAAYRAPSGAAAGAITAPDPAPPPAAPPSPPVAPQHRPASASPIGDALRRTRATSDATDDADELARMAATDSPLAREVDARLRGAKVTFDGKDATIENETGAAATDAATMSSVAPVVDAPPSGVSPPAPEQPRTLAPSVPAPARDRPVAPDAPDAPDVPPAMPGPAADRARPGIPAPARPSPVRSSGLPREQWQEFEIEDLLSAETRPSWLTEKLGRNLIVLLVFGCVFFSVARQVIGSAGVFLLVVAVVALAVILGMGRMSGRKTTTMTRDKRR